MSVYITRTMLPNKKKYDEYLNQIFQSHNLTNNGDMCRTLEARLRDFLDVKYLSLCANGTLGLELAIHAAKLTGKKVITTPFSYVATVSALLWKGCQVIFADIDEETLAINPGCIEEKMGDDIAGIMPVFIYGYPCDVEKISALAIGVNGEPLPVIYDAAQAFGAQYKGRSMLDYGDFAICSFHATKTFHTAEGGCVVCHSQKDLEKIALLRAFGHIGDEHFCLGINAKMSELHASMGLLLLESFNSGLEARKNISQAYDALLPEKNMRRPGLPLDFRSNYGYYPVIFENENVLLKIRQKLNEQNIYPRRYFYPSLNTLPYIEYQPCPVSESLAPRILCLPIYAELELALVEKIAAIVRKEVSG